MLPVITPEGVLCYLHAGADDRVDDLFHKEPFPYLLFPLLQVAVPRGDLAGEVVVPRVPSYLVYLFGELVLAHGEVEPQRLSEYERFLYELGGGVSFKGHELFAAGVKDVGGDEQLKRPVVLA